MKGERAEVSEVAMRRGRARVLAPWGLLAPRHNSGARSVDGEKQGAGQRHAARAGDCRAMCAVRPPHEAIPVP